MIRLSCRIKYLAAVCFCLLKINVSAQCKVCTTSYTSDVHTDIFVNTGQIICISSGVTCYGQVFLRGGTLCNFGTINSLGLNSGTGTLNNYGTITDNEGGIFLNGNVIVNSYAYSSLSFMSADFGFATAVDSVTFNLYNASLVNFDAHLSISDKKLAINNGLSDPDHPDISDESDFNIGDDFNIDNAGLSLNNTSAGVFNISGSLNLSNAANKNIANNGVINIYNAINIGGNGNSATTVLIDNYNTISTVNNIESSFTAGHFNLNNNDQSAPGISVGQDLVLGNSADHVSNNGVLSVSRNVILNNGVITNGYALNCSNNFSVNANGTFNNNNYVNALTFSNKGTVGVDHSSFSVFNNYYNLSPGYINGPTAGSIDTTDYARIIISGYSQNTGYLTGKIALFDESLVASTGNVGYGLDDVVPGNVSGTVIFGSVAGVQAGVPVVINHCLILSKLYSVYAHSNITFLCKNTTTSILLNAYLYTSGSLISANSFPISDIKTAVIWQPGGLNGPTVSQTIVNPQSTIVYTVTINYGGCPFTSQVTINVSTLNADAGPDQFVAVAPSPVIIGGSPTGSLGSPPYTYAWSPGSSTLANPTVTFNATITYNLVVTDAIGCTALDAVNLFLIKPAYWELKKTLDGGFYTVKNFLVCFVYKEEYANGNINFKIRNNSNVVVMTNATSFGSNINTLLKSNGDNRYQINLSNCATYLPTGYYTLEVINDKKESLYLRFFVPTGSNPCPPAN